MQSLPLVFACSLSACAALQAEAETTSLVPPDHAHELTACFGQRSLRHDYDPVDEQSVLGFEYVYEAPGSAVGWEAALFLTRDDDDDSAGVDFEGRSREIAIGAHKTFGDDFIRPYVGVGLAYLHTQIDPSNAALDEGSTFAAYAHLGARVYLGGGLFVGLDMRTLYGPDIELDARDIGGHYGQLAATFGFCF